MSQKALTTFYFMIKLFFFVLFAFSFFGCPKAHGPGIRSGLQLCLLRSCGNTRFPTHQARPGIEPVSQHTPKIPSNLLHHSGNSTNSSLDKMRQPRNIFQMIEHIKTPKGLLSETKSGNLLKKRSG